MKPVTGSIYVTKAHHKGGKGVSYTAEINYKGLRIRKSSRDREVCELWLGGIIEQINCAIVEKKQSIKAANDRERSKIEAIIEKAQQADLRYRKTAFARGLNKTAYYRTYIIYNPCSGLYKIGKSKDIYTRLVAYCLPEIELIAFADKDVETNLHKRYARCRQMGEWFALDEIDLWELEQEEDFLFV